MSVAGNSPHPNPLPACGEREPSAGEAGEGRREPQAWGDYD